MLKQFLSKLPRKSSKSEPLDSANEISYGNGLIGTGIQHAVSSGSNVIKRMSSAVFPANGSDSILVEPYSSFKDVANSNKQCLFISKLNLCCVVFDFSVSDKSPVERDLKQQALIELVDFVASGSVRFSETSISATCRMCSINLFRVFPPKNRSGSSCGETEDDVPMFDPGWSHLQIVYDLLLQFVSCNSLDVKVAKKYVDNDFLLRLLDLFDSEDPRERDCLKTIMHMIYGKFMVHRSFIRKAVSHVIYRFVFETEKHNGIGELLEIFGSIISGFALPLKDEHKMFLWKALIPLHKPKCVGIYHQPLTYCVIQFIEKESKLGSSVIKGLLKYWPVSNTRKELMFLSELEEILEMTNMSEFENIMIPLFRRIKCCINSFHFQVAERALFLCNNENIYNIITHYRRVIMPLILPALEWNAQNHWNQTVINLTLNVKKMFNNMDEELVLACRGEFEEQDSKSSVADENRRLLWECLETNSRFKHTNMSSNQVTCSVSC